MNALMSAENIYYSYDNIDILRDISLSINPGEVTSIVGPNGIGKSTLIKCLCGILKPKSGIVTLNKRTIREINPNDLAKKVGYIPQKASEAFSITVYEAVLLGRKPYISWRVEKKDIDIIDSIMERLNLKDLAERRVSELSGGERQKVAIARALVQEPDILLMDEPTSSLDINHQLELMILVGELAHNDNATVVMIVHDLNLACRYSDNVILLGKKGIIASGSPKEVFTKGNIKEVYGVNVEMVYTQYGPYIIPV